VASGEKQPFELDNSEPVFSVSFSPLGILGAAGLHNKTKIWDLTTHMLVTELAQTGDIISIVFSKDGQWLATGSADGTVILWQVAGASFKPIGEPLPLDGKPQILAFRPDGKWLAGGSSSGFAYLWNTASAQEVARIPHSVSVTGVSFSPEGSQLFTVSRKVVRIWDAAAIPLVPTDPLIPAACSHLITNLSRDNWANLFLNETYRLICPSLPEEK